MDAVKVWKENCLECEAGLTEMRWSPNGKYYFFCVRGGCVFSKLVYKLELTSIDFNRYAEKQMGES